MEKNLLILGASGHGRVVKETYGQICPSNGTISYEKGILNCEKHPGKESLDDETEEIPYI